MAKASKYKEAYHEYISAKGKVNVQSLCKKYKFDRAGFYRYMNKVEQQTGASANDFKQCIATATADLKSGYQNLGAILDKTAVEKAVGQELIDRERIANEVISEVAKVNIKYANIIRGLSGKILERTNLMVESAQSLKELKESMEIVKAANDTLGAIPKAPTIAIQNNVNNGNNEATSYKKDDVITIEVI